MADWAMVVLTAIYVIATILICVFNYRSAKATREQTIEMRRQYDADNRPYITVELIYEKRLFYGLRFTNHGKRIATRVNIELAQSFLDSLPEPSFKALLNKEMGRESIIGIGQCYELYFGTNEFKHSPPIIPLSGRVEYCDGETRYSNEFSIALDSYATFFSINSNADDFVREMKAQTKTLARLCNSMERIFRGYNTTSSTFPNDSTSEDSDI